MAASDHILHLENGKPTAANPREHVDAIVARGLAEMGDGGLVLHFHGGLVSEARGREIAKRLLPRYRDGGEAWPLFFVWESGLLETLGNNLGEILREPLFKKLLKRGLEMALRKVTQAEGQRAAGTLADVETDPIDRAVEQAAEERDAEALASLDPTVPDDLTPVSDGERLAMEEELIGDLGLVAAVQQVSNGLRSRDEVRSDVGARAATVRGSTATLMDPHALEELVDRPDPDSRGILSAAKVVARLVRVVTAVIRRFTSGRDHGFHVTVVEELLRGFYLANAGGFVWEMMKKDTADAFREDGSRAGGTAFLEALAQRMDPDEPPRLTLVGHSTGAVFISHFLEKADRLLPASARLHVVFLAPASTFELSAGTLNAHADRIAGFRMFTMSDDYERRDRLVPGLYPHSLLYFVSGVLEDEADTPLVGMERYYDRARYPAERFDAVETVRSFVDGGPARAVWSVTGDGDPPGRATRSERHGDFDNDEATLRSVTHILSAGFGA